MLKRAFDVVSSAVGLVVLSPVFLVVAILIAVVFETAGALIAGGDVVNTISGGIVAPEAVAAHRCALPAMPVFAYQAGHAFNRDVDPAAFHAPSAALARQRSLAFLAEHLR